MSIADGIRKIENYHTALKQEVDPSPTLSVDEIRNILANCIEMYFKEEDRTTSLKAIPDQVIGKTKEQALEYVDNLAFRLVVHTTVSVNQLYKHCCYIMQVEKQGASKSELLGHFLLPPERLKELAEQYLKH
ncbi:MAG: hypothetical protein WBB28_20710 [Crinalium sp.]